MSTRRNRPHILTPMIASLRGLDAVLIIGWGDRILAALARLGLIENCRVVGGCAFGGHSGLREWALENGMVEVGGGVTDAGIGLAVVGALGADHPNNFYISKLLTVILSNIIIIGSPT